ncbi:winged helix-turn-helix domain-containing protein [Aliivibrio finisterrensis]|uniref:OmpR/PhoB-type domain-containing protein n=1 Tax=Aliivibrio finisterrensis TaxID=511998 RepID=A0A6N6RVL4_9GAMM|nr:winged helix-turn-helix domain-containing protein [Aliivibrio finisterrensis]KAB2825757.1 hypothetical protein F8B77_03430 [Aliivibrio finisterrensis]
MSDSYLINGATFCVTRGRLILNDKTYLLTFTEAKLLELLSTHANEVVTKEQLKAYAWPHTVVTDSSLTKSMAKLRQAFTTIFDNNNEIIVTVPRIGYKLVSDITLLTQTASSLTPNNNNQQENKKSSTIVSRQKKLLLRYSRLGLVSLSVILLSLSALNFLNVFPITTAPYLNEDYQISDEMNNNYQYQYITPKNQIVPVELKQLLNNLNCDCTYFIEETQHRYLISVFNNNQKTAKSFTVDKDTVIDTLKQFIKEEKL